MKNKSLEGLQDRLVTALVELASSKLTTCKDCQRMTRGFFFLGQEPPTNLCPGAHFQAPQLKIASAVPDDAHNNHSDLQCEDVSVNNDIIPFYTVLLIYCYTEHIPRTQSN